MSLDQKISLVLFLFSFTKVCNTIKCYKCSTSMPTPIQLLSDKTIRLCNKFDYYDDKYIVDCPHSTMCSKIETKFVLLNKTVIAGMEKGCANQKRIDHVYNETIRDWVQVIYVDDIYEEKCTYHTNSMQKLPTHECYCRGNLCNSATRLHWNDVFYTNITHTMAVILIIHLNKFIHLLT